MEHVVHPRKHPMAGIKVADVGRLEGDARIVAVVGNVAFAPAHEIVDHAYPVPLSDQEIDHVTADEAGAARDQSRPCGSRHLAPIFFMVLTLKYQSSSKLFGRRWLRKARARSRTASSMVRLGSNPSTRLTLSEFT